MVGPELYPVLKKGSLMLIFRPLVPENLSFEPIFIAGMVYYVLLNRKMGQKKCMYDTLDTVAACHTTLFVQS